MDKCQIDNKPAHINWIVTFNCDGNLTLYSVFSISLNINSHINTYWSAVSIIHPRKKDAYIYIYICVYIILTYIVYNNIILYV